ncbi:MAG TPA: hypothetical protein VGF97_03780 [Rhizomicrobium sp.]|jgi:hypothetical protein
MTTRAVMSAFALLPLLTAQAAAATPLELYRSGQFAAAADAGRAENSAAGYALAARADLAAETMRSEPCLSCLKEAEDLAAKAVAMDPKLAEGHIEYVVSLGYEARIIGTVAANFQHFAQRAKQHIDAALADDPQNSWAWAALGGWNIEIVHGAGSALARWLYGANFKAGMQDFAKAFAVAPENVVLHYQYALSLATYDRDAYHDTIAETLTRAIAGHPESAYESFAQENARALLAALKAGDSDTFDRLLRRDQGYP